MSDQSKLGLGYIITTEQNRDAIHVAIAPVVAAERLSPGLHVGLDKNGNASTLARPIGVIDPFLKGTVGSGDKCWLFLYPGSIKSLRHEWTHPAFSESQPINTTKAASEEWMRAWAVKHMGEDYYGDNKKRPEEEAYQAAIRAGEDNHIGPYEDARDYIDNKWWNHWEIITGKKGDRGEYFSCSC